MSLQSAGALAALVLAVPLIALHFRRRKPPRRAVGSLLSWRDLPGAGGGARRRFGRPPMPLLLLLQLLALALLVFALAHPVTDRSTPGSATVFVVDESMWMGAEAGGGETRIEQAAAELRERVGALDPGEAVRIVGAGADPTVLFEGDAADAGPAIGALEVGPGAANLPAALRLAAGLRASGDDRVVLLRAPEEAAPRVRGGAGLFTDVTVGRPVTDAGVADASARCDRLGAEDCEAFVRLTGARGTATSVPVTISAAGAEAVTRRVRIPASGTTGLDFTASPGAAVEVSLPGDDGLVADDSAFVSVPEAGGERITLVGERTRALPLARALASVPGVQLRLRTPETYRPTDPGTSDLLVLDHFMPKGGLPDAPGLLVVDPPSFPGGAVLGAMDDSRLSGIEAASPLLEGTELASLTIGSGAARRLRLPGSYTAAAWSSEGPLLASGIDGGRRVAVLSFEPSESNLPQLGSFVDLVDDIVAWSQRLAPSSAAAGMPFSVAEPPGTTGASLAPVAGGEAEDLDLAPGTEVAARIARPGNYVVTVAGPWGERALPVSVNPGAAPASGAPVDLAAAPPTAHVGHHDWWRWLLVAALVALIAEALYTRWREGERSPTTRRRIATGLQVASVVLVAVALLDLTTGSSPPPTTLVLDRSLSVDPASSAAEGEWLAAGEGCGPDCHVVQFGGAAEVTGADAGPLPSAAGGGIEGRGTDLQAALELALARTPRGGRVVVLSDGRQTAGEPVALAALAAKRGISVDTVALTDEPADAAVTRLQAPPALHGGDPVSLETTVRSTVAGPARLTVRRDGEVVGRERVDLGVGDNPFLFGVRAPLRPGSYGYEVQVRADADARPQNDSLGTAVRVEGAPRAIVAAADGGTAAGLLEADGFDVASVAPGALPQDPAGYRGADAVVLEDVSGEELGKARARAIEGTVRSRALGLLALGGNRSFSLGKYYRSPLQDLLPVKSLVPGKLRRKDVAVELVLDRSGSMINEAGGVPKIAMAQAAARGAVDYLLKHRDQIGIVTFEIKAKTLLPLTPVETGNVGQIENKIDTLPANGGTNVYKGLAAGVKEILASKAKDRHIILLTDGISEPGEYKRYLPALKKAKISVAAVALGAEADFPLMKEIAAETGGNYYATENARELPKIFDKEVRLSTRTVRLRGQIGVSAGDPSPITGSLVGQGLPPLGGNVVTELKPGAEAALLGQDKNHPPDPVLAQWQFGAGRVAAWTPGLSPAFAGAWLGRPRLFQDAARWVERGVAPPPLTPTLAPGDQRTVEVTPTSATTGRPIELGSLEGELTAPSDEATTRRLGKSGPGGDAIPLRFEESSPGRWTAALPELPPGEYEYALQATGAPSETGTLAIPYPAEYRLARLDTTPLGPLAAATDGEALDVSATSGVESSVHHIWWIFAAAALAPFVIGAILRLLPGRVGRDDPATPTREDSADRDPDPRGLQPDPA